MSLAYRWKVRLLARPRVSLFWRRWRARRGVAVGHYGDLAKHVRELSSGRSFVDVGCMWGIDGDHAFLAEEVGARPVKGVDVFGPTAAFEEKRRARRSAVEFILGDITDEETIRRVGVTDVVLCAGVLYHHPSPFEVLRALRRICGSTLILRTATIPEIRGLPHAAVYYPFLGSRSRRIWNLRSLGVGHQAGISDAFNVRDGYGNWFWGLTPSCLVALLKTAGFRVERRYAEPFAYTVVCSTDEERLA